MIKLDTETGFKTRDEINFLLEENGLEFFHPYFCIAESMPDQELAQAFQNVQDAITAFKKLLPEINEDNQQI